MFAQPGVFRVNERDHDVQNDRRANHNGKAAQIKSEMKYRHRQNDRGNLTRDRNPAQRSERSQANPIGSALFGDEIVTIFNH